MALLFLTLAVMASLLLVFALAALGLTLVLRKWMGLP